MSMKRFSFIFVILITIYVPSLLFADVAPLVQSMWGTGDSWNNYCPADFGGDGSNVDVGSMAVSTAMVMKFWNHPANGVGTNTYDDAPYGTITADFENTHYNWAGMSNTLILNGTRQLLFHAGVAMNMDYGTLESYAPISNAFAALVNNFRYDATAQLVQRLDYTDTDWEQLIKTELNNGRPVLYKADTANGEIGFVIDGWRNGNQFHVNWGKAGIENGYFNLDALMFNGTDMTVGNAAVIGIYPSLGPVTVDENFEGDFSGFNWQLSGDSDWNITTNEHFYGVQAAKSGQINHNQSTSLFIEIDVAVDDVISFYQKVSCENSPGTPTYDYLSFWIDDQEMDRWDGDSYWEYEEYPVTAGLHTFTWTYRKDGATISGQDCAWIDAVDFPNGDTPLNPVQNFDVQVVNENSAQLSWQQPSLTLRNLIGYRVYRNGSELITVSNPNVLSYTDTNLPNAEYTYFVKAFYQEGLSNPSNPVTIEIEVPYAPTNLIAEVVSDDDIHLSWSRPPTFRDRSLSGYRIYRNDVAIADISNILTITYDDLNLAQAVYRYVVKAIYNVGESAGSNVAVAAIGVPIPPTGLTAQVVDGNDVLLNWFAPAGTREFLGYRIYRNSTMIMQLDDPTAVTYTDPDLTNGVYTYEVKGLYSSGESESATSAFVTIEVLYAPTNISYQIENQVNVRLTWSNPTTRNLISYSVYRDGQQIAAIFNPNRLYYLDEDLANGVYNYYVIATYTSGSSAPSQSVNVLMEVLYPCTVLTGDVIGDDITLSWDLPVNSGGLRSFNGYNIYRDGQLIHYVNSNTTLSYTDNNLANGYYDYDVTAVYTTGESTPVTVSGLFVEILYPPRNLIAQSNEDDFILNWQLPATSAAELSLSSGLTRSLNGFKVYRDGAEVAEINNQATLTYTDQSLANGFYDYYVTALYNNGESPASNQINIEMDVAYPPVGLVASVDQDDVNLTWNTPATSGGLSRVFTIYRVYRDGSMIAETGSTSYSDQNLANGSYDYYITAVYESGESAASNIETAIVEILYPARNLSATVVNRNNISLSWSLPVTSGGLTNRNLLGYKIYRNDTEIAEQSGRTFTDPLLANGVYSYYIKAVYTSGLSGDSNIVSKTIEYPYPVTGLTAIAVQDEITLSWSLPTRSITEFELYRNDTLLSLITDPATTQYIDSGLANGTYTYYLITHNDSDSGPSDPSDSATATVEVLYPARNLSATVIEDSVSLSWSVPVTSGGLVGRESLNRNLIGYKVFRNDAEIAEINTLNYTDAGLTNGNYSYYVKAVYSSGIAEASNTEDVLVEVLYPATALNAVVNQDDVTLTWNAPATSGGLTRSLIGYQIYRDGIQIAQVTELTYTDSDLTNGEYDYYVIAQYTTGLSAPSTTISASVEVLYPPTGLTANVVQDNNVQLNWTAPVTSGGLRDFVGYRVIRNNTVLATTQAVSYYDQLLADGDYSYRIEAVYNSGISIPSNTVTLNIEFPYPPTNLTAQTNDDDVILNWNAPSRTILGYRIFRNDIELATTTVTTYTDFALTNGSYSYFVKAIYAARDSDPTNTVNVTMEVLYPAVNLTGSVTDDDVSLSWNIPATSGGLSRSLSGYKIYRNNTEIAQVPTNQYNDLNLANGIYDYYVKAVYSTGLSSASNTVTIPVEVLYPATNLTYTVNQDEVTLNWNASAVSGGLNRSFLGYKVYRDDVEIADQIALTYTDIDLVNGTYSYYVKANYTSGLSEASNTVTPLVEVLYPATNLTYSVNQDEVTLNWDGAVNSGGLTRSFLGYKVYRDDVEIAEVTTLTYTDIDLSNGTYDYYVKADYTTGVSTPSNTVTAVIEVLYPATNLTYSVDQDEVTLVWDAAAINSGLNRSFLGYKVYRDNIEIADIMQTTYTDVDLTNGIYQYYVVANYSTGMSAPTSTVNALVEVLYPATNLTYSVDQDNVTLNWDAAAISGGLTRSFLGYKLYRDDVEIADQMTTSYLDAGLSNGIYNYYVKANYSTGISTPTATVSVLVEVLYPAANLTYSVDQDEVTLNWDAAAISGGLTRAFLGYKIYRDNVEIADIMQTTYTDVDLANGFYDYYIVAYYTNGMATPTNTVTAFVEVLYPATNLTYLVNQDEVTLNWDAAATSGGLDRAFLGYKVYRDDVEIADQMELTFTDVDLTNGTYTYYVKANYTSGLSEASNTVTPLVEVLYPATNLTYSVNQDEVTLSWDAAVTNGGLTRAFMGYKVYRNDVEIADLMELTYTDVDLTNGNYNYYVKANYSMGISAPTNTVNVLVEVLYPATNLTYSVDQDEVTLNWDAAATNGGLTRSFLGYKVYRDDVEIADIMATTFTDVDLTNGVYSYYVKANYTTGLSEASNTVTPLVEVLYPATNLTYSVDQDVVTLNWDAAVISGGLTRAFLGYKVYRDDVEIADVLDLTYTDANLTNGVYNYYVKANYTTGMSAASNTVNVLIEVLYPAANLIYSVDQDEVTLNWDAAATNGGLTRAFLGYKVYRDDVEIADVMTTTYTDVDLTNGTYDYYIVAGYSTGMSTPTNTVNVLVEVLYPATNLTYSVVQDDVTLNWDAVAISGGLDRAFLGYKIYRNDIEIADIMQTTYTDFDLANGTYSYYVKANYTMGMSEPTNTVTMLVELLYPASNLTYSVDQDMVSLAWDTAPINGGITRDFLGYNVFRNNVEIATVTETSYDDVDLTNGVYSYYVVAEYSTGNSTPTNTVTAIIEVLYPAMNLTYNVNADQVVLSWDPAALSGGLTRSFLGYKVYRDDMEIADVTTTSYSDNGLANGSYDYYIRAEYTSGIAAPSNTVTAIVEVLYPARNLTASVSNDIVTLNWDAPVTVGGLTRSLLRYKIYRDFAEIAEVTTTTFDDSGLANGTYNYYVKAVYTSGLSAASNSIDVTVEVLYPATGLTAVVQSDDVRLNWVAPTTSNLRTLMGYKVYRNSVQIAQLTGITYLDSNLANGTYDYSIVAYYNTGDAIASNIATVTVEVTYAPTNLTASVIDDVVTLNWTAPVISGGLTRSFNGYFIYRNGDLEHVINNPSVVSYDDANLANGTYEYYIVAVYDAGISAHSNTVQAIVNVLPDLFPPTDLVAVITNLRDVNLSWTAPAGAPIAYRIYRDAAQIAEVAVTTYDDLNLANGSYTYWVKAVYNEGVSSNSNSVDVNIEIAYAPQNLVSSVDYNDVTLNWDAPTAGETGYLVYRDNVEIALINNPLVLSYTDLDLTNGTYEYFVKAIYSTTISSASNMVSATVEIIYPAGNLTVLVTGSDAQLDWTEPIDVVGLIEYKIYKAGVYYASTTDLTYTDSNLANGSYQYYVTAMYGTGESVPTSTVTAVIGVIYPVQNVVAVATANSVDVSWDAPADLGGLLTYRVRRDGVLLEAVTTLTYNDSPLPNGTYTYSVIAHYSFGDATSIEATPVNVLQAYAPSGLTAQSNGMSVELNWNQPTDIGGLTGYNIYKDGSFYDFSSTNSYDDANQVNGTYSYYVTALYGTLESSASNTVNSTVQVTYAPSNLTFTINDNEVSLDWSAPVDLGGFVNYNIYRDGSSIATTTTTQYIDMNLANDVYNYYVTAVYSFGESAPSNPINPAIQVTYIPSNLLTQVNDADVQLSWTAAADLGGFVSYRVYRDGSMIAEPTAVSFTDIDLANGSYDYSVTTMYLFGESEATSVVSATVEVAYAPETAEASVVPTSHFALVNWTAPADAGLLTGYKVYRLMDGEQTTPAVWTMVAEMVTELTYTDESFATLPDDDYLFAVIAEYASGALSEHTFTNLLNPTDNENNSQTPVKTALLGNYPNPFNPDTTINFALDANSDVVINIFNNKGQLVKTVLNKNMTTGQHSVVWNGIDKNGRTVPSGVYFIRMNSNGYSRTTKAVLMK